MQNKYFKFLIIALAVAVIVPQVALAAWWNPLSWGWVNRIFHFQRTEQKQKQEQEQKQEQPKNKLQADNSASSTSPTDDWKTYTNTQYGFEFKYPKDWVADTNRKGGIVFVWTPENKKQYDASSTAPVHAEFSVIYWDKASFLTKASEAAKKNITNVKDFVAAQFTRYLEATRDGKQAYAGIVSGENSAYIEYVEAKNGVFVLTVSYPENPEQNPKTKLNGQILSSFKFTN
ncbi:MAG: PsbP-related protein [Candidatus Staskawiczbacteria bacterium]|nr:PsbP-related protein [Candidatus Staskawiczbacteria bacterium]